VCNEVSIAATGLGGIEGEGDIECDALGVVDPQAASTTLLAAATVRTNPRFFKDVRTTTTAC
jgi:hypothetical protein